MPNEKLNPQLAEAYEKVCANGAATRLVCALQRIPKNERTCTLAIAIAYFEQYEDFDVEQLDQLVDVCRKGVQDMFAAGAYNGTVASA